MVSRIVVVVSLVSACGAAGRMPPRTTPATDDALSFPSPSTTERAAFASARYCDLVGQFYAVLASLGFAAGSEMADASADSLAGFMDGMGVAADELEANAPTPLHADVKIVLEAIRKGATGDRSGLDDQPFGDASARMAAHRAEHCPQDDEPGGTL